MGGACPPGTLKKDVWIGWSSKSLLNLKTGCLEIQVADGAWWTSNNIGFENKSQPKAPGLWLWEIILKRLNINLGWWVSLMILAQLFFSSYFWCCFKVVHPWVSPFIKKGSPISGEPCVSQIIEPCSFPELKSPEIPKGSIMPSLGKKSKHFWLSPKAPWFSGKWLQYVYLKGNEP